jgi:hypothetical protein
MESSNNMFAFCSDVFGAFEATSAAHVKTEHLTDLDSPLTSRRIATRRWRSSMASSGMAGDLHEHLDQLIAWSRSVD